MARQWRRMCLAGTMTWVLAGLGPARAAEVSVDASRWPYTAIGKLNVVIGPGSRRFCTATLIGPRLALTAAHCLWDKARGRWVEPASVHFVAGYALGAYIAHSVASRAHVPEAFDPDAPIGAANLAHDRALLELAQAVPVRPIDLDDEPHGPVVAGIAWAGYRRDRNQVLSAEAGCQGHQALDGRLMVVPGCRAVQGESGSAVLTDLETRPRIAGVLVAGPTAAGRNSIAVPVGAFLAEARGILARHAAAARKVEGSDRPKPR